MFVCVHNDYDFVEIWLLTSLFYYCRNCYYYYYYYSRAANRRPSALVGHTYCYYHYVVTSVKIVIILNEVDAPKKCLPSSSAVYLHCNNNIYYTVQRVHENERVSVVYFGNNNNIILYKHICIIRIFIYYNNTTGVK